MTDGRRFPEAPAGEAFSREEWRVLEAAVAGGVGAIQVREKDLDGGALYARVTELVSLCRPKGVRVLVNDRADVAHAAGADGVHLPGAGLSVDDARAVVGRDARVGRSIHDRAELAACRGVDYAIFGPIFDTPSKRRYGAPQGLERLADVSRTSDVPIVAIGGITADRARDVLVNGAAGVAVMGAILSADDPHDAVRAFRAALVRA